MVKEITQSVIAILVVAGAICAAILGLAGTQYLIGIAGIVIGFYFKDSATALGNLFGKKLGKKK
jgi:uncharacterized membrane protein YuzA (DUF378 family)